MILGQSSPQQMAFAANAGRATLDDMFCRSVARHPDAVALADPPHRESFTDGPPRCLTYAEADRMIDAIAAKLRRLGLHTDHVVALQMPNTIEGVLTLLGVLRAGMIAAPLPLLWRSADAVAALSRVGAKALVTCRRVGATDHCELAMNIAAETFPIRHVCAFGRDLPDGIVPLDDLPPEAPDEPMERATNPAAHLALVTWEPCAAGLMPVARNHVELLAAGLAVVLEGRIEPGAALVSTLGTASLAGLAVSVLPWLMVGGTLCLHHAFDAAAFAEQLKEHGCRSAVVPGPLASRLAQAGMLSRANGLATVLAVWRAPERLAGSAEWTEPATSLVDIQAFGETGLIAARRGANGRPASIALGAVTAPRGMPGATMVAEIARSAAGTLVMRGAMVPRFAFPPGAERGDAPCLRPDPELYVDTGYACRIERETGAMTVTAPPAGLMGIGGYRFALAELQRLAAEVDAGSTLAALPDTLTGQRLAGHAEDCAAVRQELAQRGVNPLIAGAFRDRRGREQSAERWAAA
jgi:hypothetical protein